MSQENVEIVGEVGLAVGIGDPVAKQAADVRFFDPSIEWDMSGVFRAGFSESKPTTRSLRQSPRGVAPGRR